MISELLPRDILHLIVSLSAERYPDEELARLLPPRFVREAYLAEVGVLAPLRPDPAERVRDWHREQVALQTRAILVHQRISEIEPFTQEMAVKGEFPKWTLEKWSERLLFDWSADLGQAVEEAEEYLESKTSVR